MEWRRRAGPRRRCTCDSKKTLTHTRTLVYTHIFIYLNCSRVSKATVQHGGLHDTLGRW